MRKLVLAALAALTTTGAAGASPLEGKKELRLVDGAGEAVVVGTVVFDPGADGVGYAIDWNEEMFGEYFLSMRPFKCLQGPEKLWCRVPYPYEIRRQVHADDLTDLEYDTLFIWKKASDYGIDMWNGIYYRFELTGDGLVGALHEIDMGLLAVPPDEGELRPVGEYDIEPGDPASHWLPVLRIE